MKISIQALFLLFFLVVGFKRWDMGNCALLPLKQGNEWKYVLINDKDRSIDTLTYIVSQDTLLDDTLYHVFEKISGGRISLKLFLREDTGRIYLKEKSGAAECVYLPSVKDSVGLNYEVTERTDVLKVELLSLDTSLQTPVDNYDSLISTQCTILSSGASLIYFFKPGLGLVGIKSHGQLSLYLIAHNVIE